MLGSDVAAAGSRGSHPQGARHHGSGARVVIVGGPVYPRYYYARPYPYYYYPPPFFYYTPAPPPVYIEQPQLSSEAYWYFCQATGTYYPYVQSCASGWQRMLPQSTPN